MGFSLGDDAMNQDEVNPNSKEAAKKRQDKLDKDKAEFIKRGGKVVKL